jgi:hypothetical protein
VSFDFIEAKRLLVAHIVKLRDWDAEYARQAQLWYENTTRNVFPDLRAAVACAWRAEKGLDGGDRSLQGGK